MNKLVAVKFVVDKASAKNGWKVGDEYTYFQDPDSKKYYMPKEGFTVTGEKLEDKFNIVSV